MQPMFVHKPPCSVQTFSVLNVNMLHSYYHLIHISCNINFIWNSTQSTYTVDATKQISLFIQFAISDTYYKVLWWNTVNMCIVYYITVFCNICIKHTLIFYIIYLTILPYSSRLHSFFFSLWHFLLVSFWNWKRYYLHTKPKKLCVKYNYLWAVYTYKWVEINDIKNYFVMTILFIVNIN